MRPVSVSRRAVLLGLAAAPLLAVLSGCAPDDPDGVAPTAADPGTDADALPHTAPSASNPPLEDASAAVLHPLDGDTTMSVWAHYDDDLLFLDAPLVQAVRAGGRVCTVYLTGGDAGRGAEYEAGRERGIMAAYDEIRDADGAWSRTAVRLNTGAQVDVWSPGDDDRITLVFFRLPDGSLAGTGFPSTGEVSLSKLAGGLIHDLPDLDDRYRLDWHGLIGSLQELIADFAPKSFYTHVPGTAHRLSKGDHPDHSTTGTAAHQAWRQAAVPGGAIAFAVGYQDAAYPANVVGDALARKVSVFRAYAEDDAVTAACRDERSCLAVPRFGGWLQREYLKSEADLARG
ncbi:PIG-L family deacetylase [Microbacterium sp. NPDC091313]